MLSSKIDTVVLGFSWGICVWLVAVVYCLLKVKCCFFKRKCAHWPLRIFAHYHLFTWSKVERSCWMCPQNVEILSISSSLTVLPGASRWRQMISADFGCWHWHTLNPRRCIEAAHSFDVYLTAKDFWRFCHRSNISAKEFCYGWIYGWIWVQGGLAAASLLRCWRSVVPTVRTGSKRTYGRSTYCIYTSITILHGTRNCFEGVACITGLSAGKICFIQPRRLWHHHTESYPAETIR